RGASCDLPPGFSGGRCVGGRGRRELRPLRLLVLAVGHGEDLFERRAAFQRDEDALLAEREAAFLAPLRLQHVRGGGGVDEAAALVWGVAMTRWPVRAACTATRADSWSRISPTMMMSGSWRRIERRARAKVRPTGSCTWIWLISSSWYSTGSSMVTMFSSGLR